MQKVKRNLLFFPLLLLCGCQVYNSHFDCPPGCGVPCTPVTTLEKMVVETEEGPDLFLGFVPKEEQNNPSGFPPYCTPHFSKKPLRVWVEGKHLPCGTYVEGHFIYLRVED